MMILFVKLTKGIGHKFCQLMKSSPIRIMCSSGAGCLPSAVLMHGHTGQLPEDPRA